STTRRMPSSASNERSASVSSAITASSNALWRSGRFIVTMPTGPWRSIAIALIASHPEYAEARFLGRGLHRDREREPQHAARVRGIDHAVVPQARGGVVRVALALVLVADRRLERLFLVRGPLPLLRLDAVAPHGREHGGGLLAAHHGDARV